MPDKIEIAARIRRVLIDGLSLNLREQDLAYGRTLDQVAGLDSLTLLEFVAAIEKEFGITIEAEQLELALLKDLDRLAGYIAGRMASAGAAGP